jgi:hypothetical protein
MLSPLFAAATLVSFMACAPMQTEMSGDENTPVATVLRTAGLQNTVVVEGAHPTPYGLTSRDYTLENPYDLAPADQIIGRVIEEELASMPKEQVLVILSGENHDVSSHKMAHIGTLTHLVKMCDENPDDPARQFLFATELPFNYMEAGADFYKISVPAKLQYHLHEFDQDYRLAMTMEMADPRLKGSPQAMSRLFHAVLQHHIPAIFNDAAHRDGEEGRELDKKAPLSVAVRTVLDRFPDYTGWPIHVLSSAGVVGRNADMVERAMAASYIKWIGFLFLYTGGINLFVV